MTKIIRETMYCKRCNKSYEVPVILSTNSFMIEHDPVLRQKVKNGTLDKNLCPVCKMELVRKENEH